MHAPQKLRIDGHELEYRKVGTGAGDAPVLVFLHDGLGSVSTWRDFPDRLADATGMAAFVYSRAGYGHSSRAALPRPVSFMHDEARLLPAVCGAAGIRCAILVGHSDGASIALLHAGGPERDALPVRALALIAPHVFVEDVTTARIRELQQGFPLGPFRQRLAQHHADPEHSFGGWSGIWLAEAFRAWNIESCLAGIQVPVVLVQGDRDEFGTERQLDAIERGIPGPVERFLLPGCGHAPQRDAPDATLHAILDFLSRRTAP